MPRKGWVLRRKIPGDPVYGSDLVQKFISSMMYDGKRSTAQTIFYKDVGHVGIILSLLPGFRGKAPLRRDMLAFIQSH